MGLMREGRNWTELTRRGRSAHFSHMHNTKVKRARIVWLCKMCGRRIELGQRYFSLANGTATIPYCLSCARVFRTQYPELKQCQATEN